MCCGSDVCVFCLFGAAGQADRRTGRQAGGLKSSGVVPHASKSHIGTTTRFADLLPSTINPLNHHDPLHTGVSPEGQQRGGDVRQRLRQHRRAGTGHQQGAGEGWCGRQNNQPGGEGAINHSESQLWVCSMLGCSQNQSAPLLCWADESTA